MKRLLLLGGGHAHLHVLRAFAKTPPGGAEVLLVSPHGRQFYSGMLPGFVAGHYTADQCSVPLPPLAAAARAYFVQGTAVAIDTATRRVSLADGQVAEYDVLSLDIGAAQDRDAIPGAREHALFVRPVERFVALLDGLVELAGRRLLDVVVVGGGAAGVEIAMALWHRLARGGPGSDERARIVLVAGAGGLLPGYAPRMRERTAAALAARRITLLAEACTAIDAASVQLANGARLACDAPVVATGAHPPAFLADVDIAKTDQGFIATGPTLQSTSHPEVFAAGDVAGPGGGVRAVRAGPALALNLARYVAGGELQPHLPPQSALSLIACGDRRAIAARGGWSGEGRWAWWWKDWIDRRFVGSHLVTASA